VALMRFTVLGCGSSPGVPRINGDWGNCDPDNVRNRRLRASLLVERVEDHGGKTTVVIDTGPDFRAQMLAAKVTELDGVVYTHSHADHIHGIDDLRGYWIGQNRLIDVYADDATLVRLRDGFGYCFKPPQGSSYPAIVRAHEIRHYEPFEISGNGGSIRFEPLTQVHGAIQSLGFRIGDFAYCTDVSDFPIATVERLSGLKALIIDALQYKPHPSHLSLDEAVAWIERFEPKNAYLTHMHTPLDHDMLKGSLPTHVEPSYDGLSITLAVQ
jgi:phosphoribosyl 1,2-cyclic phosphate phosphodiesterase